MAELPICLTLVRSSTPWLVVLTGIAKSRSPPSTPCAIAVMVSVRSFAGDEPPSDDPTTLTVSPTAYPEPAVVTVTATVDCEYTLVVP